MSSLLAEPVYHPSGPMLTFGGMTHRQLVVSDMGNPAHAAIDTTPEDDSGRYGVGLSLGLGIEYDGNDNLFDLLDQGGSDAALAPGDDSALPGDGQDSTINIQDIIDKVSLTPEQEARLQALATEISDKAVNLGSFLFTTMTGLNAKAFVSADLPVLISRDNDSAWTLGVNYSLTTNLRGLNDPIDLTALSSDNILQTLQDVSNLQPTDGLTTYTVGKSTIAVDPATGEVSYYTANNSGTITRAAQITEVGIGYSRKVWQRDENKVYVGIKPKYYDVGLSNSFVFISNIENAKSIFDALDKSSFKYTQGFGIDLGAIWTGKQYLVGATLTNINEPEFKFPDVDTSGIQNPDIVNYINDSQTYIMQHQLKLEAGYITQDGAWGVNVGLDANAVPDPMRDDYQWLSFGAGFASDSWWLPGARLGVRHNLAGSELTYVTGGITVFNIVNLDVATTTDTIKVDGTTYPRSFIVNIGAQVLF